MHAAIRRAALTDVPILTGMMEDAHSEAGFTLEREGAAAAFTTLLRDELKGYAWIAFCGKVPVGYVVLTFKLSMECGGMDGFIDDLFVRRSSRRSGIGGALLSETMATCQRNGLFAIHVEVGADNEGAKALYTRYGLQDRNHVLLSTALRENAIAKRS